MLRLEAHKRGYSQAKTRLFLADGAKGIREMKDLNFPEAIRDTIRNSDEIWG